MQAKYLNKFFWIVGLILLQVFVLNKICIGGFATPFVYIYILLNWQSNISRNTLLILGFILGLVIDILSDTPGVNATATVALAMFRPGILKMFIPRDMVDVFSPSFRVLGVGTFNKYVIVSTLIHHSILLSISYLSFVDMANLIMRILLSVLLTVLCIISLEALRN